MSHADPVLLHAAGSLRDALNEVAASYERATGIKVTATYGASGTLREQIEHGTRAEVFASANMEHPLALARAGRSGPVALFARNQLCALVRPGLAVTPATVLERMLEPQVKLGTSTPRADPSGDYAWDVFRKADAIHGGAFTTLSQKALQLTGSPISPAAPVGRNLYGMLVAQGRADLFLTYCTNAKAAAQQNPGQQIVALPDQLAVGADYGLTVMLTASPAAWRFAFFILSNDGQHILANHGFAAPGLPH
jgi:molybdenum ABC transporter molybdate-binding protein